MSKPNKNLSLKELKEIWYKKLKKSGFHDIEKSEDHLHEWHSKRFLGIPKEVFKAKVDYYTMAERFLNDYPFETNMDKLVWEYHSQGVAVREIAQLLKKVGVKSIKISKSTIWLMVKRLRNSMYSMYSTTAEYHE